MRWRIARPPHYFGFIGRSALAVVKAEVEAPASQTPGPPHPHREPRHGECPRRRHLLEPKTLPAASLPEGGEFQSRCAMLSCLRESGNRPGLLPL